MDCFSWVRSRQLGAVSGKISKDCGPNDGVNVAGGGGLNPCCMEMACRRIITQSSARNRIILKFLNTSAKAKTWVSMLKNC
jgi:hypothetical protein